MQAVIRKCRELKRLQLSPDSLLKNLVVIPSHAGFQSPRVAPALDSRLRGNDEQHSRPLA
jgi:hypothetical protein